MAAWWAAWLALAWADGGGVGVEGGEGGGDAGSQWRAVEGAVAVEPLGRAALGRPEQLGQGGAAKAVAAAEGLELAAEEIVSGGGHTFICSIAGAGAGHHNIVNG